MPTEPTTPNKNALKGFSCPNCNSSGPFSIQVTTWAVVTDDGFEEFDYDSDWDDNSAVVCCHCMQSGNVYDFRKVQDGEAKGT